MPLATRRTTVGARGVHVRVAGDGHGADAPTIVLVHGWMAAGRYLERAATRLGDDHRVLVPDLPGMGLSDRPARAPTLGDLAESLLVWMDAEALERVVLVGHSAGAQVALKMATRQPDRVARLVLASPTVEPGRRTVASQLARLALDALLEGSPRLVAWWLRDLRHAGADRALATLRDVLRDHPEEALPYVPIPTLVVRGTLDPLVSRRWTRAVAAALPRGEHAEIAGAAHAVPYTAAGRFAGLVRRFAAGA